jgi:hypothetical protein
VEKWNAMLQVRLSGRQAGIGSEGVKEFMGEEDIVGLVFGFELVATDGAVGASEVSWFPG